MPYDSSIKISKKNKNDQEINCTKHGQNTSLSVSLTAKNNSTAFTAEEKQNKYLEEKLLYIVLYAALLLEIYMTILTL
jgi:hypothetical protein